MNGYRIKNRMCNRPEDEVNEDDYEDTYEKGISGSKHRVRRFSDGTSTVYWGGPCFPTSYDENGEEC